MKMSNVEKELYINRTAAVMANKAEHLSADQIIKDEKYHYLHVPSRLYRYCRFDENGYSLDAIRNQYLYLTPTGYLDDQFEIAVNMAKMDSLEKMEKIRARIVKSLPVRQSEVIRSELSDPEFISKNRRIISELSTMDEKLGLCALTEEKANQVMWAMYGDYYRGMLIEYEISPDNYEVILNLLPVLYKKRRNSDPADLFRDIVTDLRFSKGQKKTKESLLRWLFKVISTKNEEWAFQKEWRIIGPSGTKVKTPPIKAVYLGQSVSQENREIIMQLSRELGFEVWQQDNDFEKMKVIYRKVK